MSQYELYYWPGFAGRGEFVRLMFAVIDVPFLDHAKATPDACRADIIKIRTGAWPEFGPVFAPPFLVAPAGITLCQTGVIVKYLGKKHGLCPENAEDEAKADMISACAHDYIAEGRSAFHPVDNTASYSSQKEEAAVAVAKFLAPGGRFQHWMGFFEKCLAANAGGSGYFAGSALSYADVQMFHILRASEFQFPEAFAAAATPLLKAFYERMKALPRIADYIAHKATPFAGDSLM